MTKIARISLACPPMPIYAVSRALKRTAEEPMKATVAMPDGAIVTIDNVVIPQTLVRRKGLLNWMVDECIGKGNSNGYFLTVTLPQEPVYFNLEAMTMVAQPITAYGTLVTPDGSIGSVLVNFPACPTNILEKPITADACEALGTVTFGGGDEG